MIPCRIFDDYFELELRIGPSPEDDDDLDAAQAEWQEELNHQYDCYHAVLEKHARGGAAGRFAFACAIEWAAKTGGSLGDMLTVLTTVGLIAHQVQN